MDLPDNAQIVEQQVMCIVDREAQKGLTAHLTEAGYTEFHEFDGYPEDGTLVVVVDVTKTLPPLAFVVRPLTNSYEEICSVD